MKSGRDEVTGRLVPDPVKFPKGIDGLADDIHAMGLKLGIYSSAGDATCANYPGSIGHEYIDAETFASWGVDYLKYDNCWPPANWTDRYAACLPDSDYSHFHNGTCEKTDRTAPPGYDWSTSKTALRYRLMRDALLAQNRTILYSICEWGWADVCSWGNETGNSWRMSGDITPDWRRIAELLNMNSFLLHSVDFWGHNDADMLEVGNGDLTLAETRSHFALWAAMKSPLLIGTALDRLPAEQVAILANRALLAFSQDETYGKPAMPYKWGVNPDWTFNASHPAEYWSGASERGTLVLMMNTLGEEAAREARWDEVPQLEKGKAYQVMDVWTGKNLGCVEVGVRVVLESHDTAALLIGEKCKPRELRGQRVLSPP